jgi:hypothetical protein
MQRLSLKLQMRSTLCAMAAALSLLTSAAPSFAQNADGIEVLDAGAVEAPLSESATQLAKLIIPLPLLRKSQQTFNSRVFSLEMRRNPEAAAILQREPGLMAAVRKANDAAILGQIEADYPILVDNLAIHYDRALSEEQRVTLLKFLQTSAGTNLVIASMAPADPAIILKVMMDNDGVLELSEIKSYLEGFRKESFARLSENDRKVVSDFLQTEVGRIFQEGFDEEDRISINWINSVNSKLPPLVMNAVMIAVENHMNKGRQ